MRHLFILNPAAKRVKGKVGEIQDWINTFFKEYPDISYDIYISKWCRDLVTYIRQYIMDIREYSDEIVRVHSMGGTGTLFEAVNGIAGIDGTEVAAYPYGRTNAFIKYFKPFGTEPFDSIRQQVFGKTVPMDTIRCGNNYAICFCITGLEAYCDNKGDKLIEKGMPVDISFIAAAMQEILSSREVTQKYRVEIDGQRVDGEYITILIANTPCYGQNMYPAVEAHPDDGKLEIYLHQKIPKFDILRKTMPYLKGQHEKIKTIKYFSAKKITLVSDKVMCLNIDSETFYGTSMEYEINPKAVQFVLPDAINIAALPQIYNKPEGRQRGER